MTAEEYLAAVDAFVEADAAADAAADASAPLALEVVGRTPLPLAEPRGLAVVGDAVWVADAVRRELVRFDAGAETGAWPLPACPDCAVVDLAARDGAVFVGYGGATWRFVDGAFTEALAHDDLRGLARTPDGLVSNERDGLNLREGAQLGTALVLDIADGGTLLARPDAGFLLYVGSPDDGAVRLIPRFLLADAGGRAEATTLAELMVDADVWPVTGVDADGARVWLLGAGYGDDASVLVELELQ